MRSSFLIILSFIPAFIFPGTLAAQNITAEENYAANSPGVVMVQTVFSATVYVNKVEVNSRQFDRLVDSVRKIDPQNTVFSAEEKLDMVVKALYNLPFRYFSGTTEYYRQQHRILSAGTGFFITGDGYLLTNAHIIDRDSAFVRKKFIQSTFQEVTDANIRALESSWNMKLNDEQRSLLSNAYSAIYSQVSSMILFNLKRDIFIQFKGKNEAENIVKMPARVIIKGSPMPGKDVAILKVDSVSQMPTLSFARDSMAKIGETIYVYGYPEPVSSNTFLAKEAGIEPTLTAGIVSAIKKSTGGWPVIQMDAAISHGSSGSPVCNSRGKVIGLATFGTLEQRTGSLASSYNFAIPLSIIRQFIDSAKIKPAMSEAALHYNEGLHFFFNRYYRKALSNFNLVSKLNKSYPHLDQYIRVSTEKKKAGEDRDLFDHDTVFRIMAILIVAGGLYFVFKRRRKRFSN